MANQVKDIYFVHHSHTDIGYTDLQERVIYSQINYIRDAVNAIKKGYEENTSHKDFKWNCETYYCVEKFLEDASEQEKEDFFELVKKGNIGISATYLNFNDLVDAEILNERTAEMVDIFKKQNFDVKVAMNADINGIHMGARDAFIDNGVEFLFTNIHTHHGMYPLKGNRNAYYWENEAGKKLLVFNGEHYNLGNYIGMVFDRNVNLEELGISTQLEYEKKQIAKFKTKIDELLTTYDEVGYDYDFVVSSVSGVFSDNAPPTPELIETVELFNAEYDDIKIHMVTLQELYDKIKDKIKDAPTYKGDLNDWWAHGINSTPYPVKHYKEAVRMYHSCKRMNKDNVVDVDKYMRIAQDNLMLYAEHTWGHSSTITNPYDTMVLNLDMRKNSYASKAHEACAMAMSRIQYALGDKLRYYDMNGKFKAVNTSQIAGKRVVSFYIGVYFSNASSHIIEVQDDATGKVMQIQLSPDPRGVRATFVDEFKANETKTYKFYKIKSTPVKNNSNQAYMGSEGIVDIVSEHSDKYDLQHKIENDYFRIEYNIRNGIKSFYNKRDNIELLNDGDCKFFTPVYEVTEIKTNIYEERRLMGRNIRGVHAQLDFAKATNISVINHGKVFTTIEIEFALKGTTHCSVVIQMYNEVPRIDFKYKFAKTIESDVENLFVPIGLNVDKEISFNKGGVKMRPAIDQIPFTNNEYYTIDCGVLYGDDIIVRSNDVPMVYTGELQHHAIRLCENNPEENKRDLYSWVMNNIWETNFKMDLSGFSEFCYSIELTDKIKDAEALQEHCMDTITFIVE